MFRALLSILIILYGFELYSQSDVSEIDALIEATRKTWEIPGMAVGIVKDGKVVLANGYGLKESGKKELIDEQTVFAIASNTKAFIAAALACLVDDGKLKWNDPVRKYLPDFELYDPYVTQRATIEDLLCHRIGLGGFSGDLMWYKSSLRPEELIRKIKYLAPTYEFRDGFGYSNLMYITAGEVIRAVSGQTWNEFIQDRFLRPLKMDRTTSSTQQLLTLGNFATPHKPFENANKAIRWVNWDNMGAAGGLISSVEDMNNWMTMLLNNGIYEMDTLLSSKQINLLWTPHNPLVISEKAKQQIPNRNFYAYGMGWYVGDYFGQRMVTHSGGYDGMYSRVLMLPDTQLGIVILTNSMKGIGFPLALSLADRFLGNPEKDWSGEWLERSNRQHSEENKPRNKTIKNVKSNPVLHPTAYVGTYYSPIHGNVQITSVKDELKLSFENAPALDAMLTHWQYEVWQLNWKEEHAWFGSGTAQFLLDNELQPIGLKFDVPNKDIFFDELDLVKIR